MKILRKLIFAGLLLAGCANQSPTSGPAAPALEAESAPATAAATEVTSPSESAASDPTATFAPAPTEAAQPEPVVERVIDPNPHATDPATVSLASGEIQLVEFFAFW